MKTRRVLHVSRNINYGCGNVVDQLTRALDRKRYEPIIAFDTHELTSLRKKLYESGIKIVDLKKPFDSSAIKSTTTVKSKTISEFLSSKFNTKAANVYLSLKGARKFALHQAPRIRSFLKLIRDHQIDLVHTHSNLNHGKPEIIAARVSGIPCVSHVHGYIEPTWFEKSFLIFVNAFIYISNDIAEHFYSRGFPMSKGVTIHNGVDLKSYPRHCSSIDVRREFNVKSDDILVGLIGRIDWWKGHDYFIDAFAEAANHISGLRALVIGEPSGGDINYNYYNMLKTKIKTSNLNGRIVFTGFRSDVQRLMSSMDIVVHASSRPEPFGLVAIEGMAAGKPVIATAAGGILDIIQDGVTGMLVPCKDSGSMAKAIIELALNKKKAEQIGLASRQRIAEKFTINHQAAAVEKLYDSLLSAF
jgi:glycosyltransferase involved in cell wall biosynthesis